MRYAWNVSLLLVLVLCQGTSSYAQTDPAVQNLPRVNIVPPGSPTYDSIIESTFPKFKSNSAYQIVRASTIAILNNTPHNVKIIVIKWVITDSAGKTTVRYGQILPRPQTLVRLPGAAILLEPSQVALASPFGSILPDSSTQSFEQFSRLSLEEPIREKWLVPITIKASIDSVIFGGGVIVGKDEYGMKLAFPCERSEMINAAQYLLSLRGNDSDIQSFFQANIKSDTDNKSVSSCTAAKRKVAMELQRIYQSSDVDQFYARMQEIAVSKQITLKALGLPSSK